MHTIDELRRVAEHDDLTNLYNRKFFKRYLNEVLSLCKITKKQFALLYIDVNNFKFFNDNYGHLAGDQVLITASNYFKSFFRSEDVTARLGGDEFAILIELKKDYDIKQYADNLLARVNSMDVIFNDHHLKINISIGICIISKETESVDKVLESADNACYDAKKRKELGSQYTLT
jgi:diguanylate cyclase (GGDEF)-like protein